MHRSMKAAAVIAAMSLLAAASLAAAPRGAGQGMMGGPGTGGPGGQFTQGRGMMGGSGMMGRGSDSFPGWENLKKLDKALTVETAKERVVSALKDWGYADLVVDSVAEYDNGFYALVKEKASGQARTGGVRRPHVRNRFRRAGPRDGLEHEVRKEPALAAAVGEDHHGRRGEESRRAVARSQPRSPRSTT